MGTGLDEEIAKRRRLHRPGHHRAPAASAVSWHNSRFCEPPPTTWITSTGWPESCLAWTVARRTSPRGCPGCSGRSGSGIAAPAPPSRRRPRRSARHVTRRQKDRLVRVDPRAGRQGGGLADQILQVGPRHRADSRSAVSPEQEPQSHDVAQIPVVPSTPRSLVKFAARLSSVSTGAWSSTPTRAPCATGDVGEVRPGRYADHRRRGVVRADRGEPEGPVRTRALGPNDRGSSPTTVPGGTIPGNSPAGIPRASSSPGAKFPVRASTQPGGGRVGVLGDLFARQPVAEQVRGSTAPGSRLQPGLRRELVERVERQELQTIDPVKPGRSTAGARIRHGNRPRVTVVAGVAAQYRHGRRASP